MKIFDTRCKDIVPYCMKMCNVHSSYHDIMKHKCSASFFTILCRQRTYCAKFVKISLKRNCVVILVQTVHNNIIVFSLVKFLFNLI